MPRIFDLGEYHEKLTDVHLIIGEGLCSNIYVIGREEACVVDPGVGNSANPVWPQLEELGVTPDRLRSVIITHAHHDHAMGAFLILQKADPKIFVHTLDTMYIAARFGPNLVKVEEGNVIETERWPLEVIWTPGHTEGGMCLYNSDDKILISGDTVFAEAKYGTWYGESGSLDAMVESLRKLAELDVDFILPGHGAPVFEGANENIRTAYDKASSRI